jgi:hypothetical protein
MSEEPFFAACLCQVENPYRSQHTRQGALVFAYNDTDRTSPKVRNNTNYRLKPNEPGNGWASDEKKRTTQMKTVFPQILVVAIKGENKYLFRNW